MRSLPSKIPPTPPGKGGLPIRDFSDFQEVVRLCFGYLGLTWQSPRVRAYLDKLANLRQRPQRAGCDLSFEDYRQLAITLARLCLDEGLCPSQFEEKVLRGYYEQLLEGGGGGAAGV